MVLPSLDDRTVLVTGASSGIGRETVHAVAREGANVALAARREERLRDIADEVEAEFDVETYVVPTDVTDETAVDGMIDETVGHFGSLDVLVNNAGLARGGDVADLGTEEFDVMMDTNCAGVFYATRAALPHLVESRGNLVMVGSFAGQYPRPANPVYAATKWWVRGFAASVQAQYGDDGLGVTVVNPTEVRTEFGGQGDSDPFKERFSEEEATDPEEIADAVAFAARHRESVPNEIDLYRRDKFTDW